MSEAGRPPVPTWLKELRGTLQPRQADGEPQPEAAIYIPPPRELADRPHASEFWEVHLPLLVKNRMITEVDMTAFAAACLAYEAWIQAEGKVKTEGEVVKTGNGYLVLSPWSTIASSRRKEFIDLLREFGLTPSSRTRIKVQIIPPGAHDGRRSDDQGFFEFD
jgi:P27 family predicted phage terminase small subunit